jgi:uncharacterized protein YndB with AHSA1/START domain
VAAQHAVAGKATGAIEGRHVVVERLIRAPPARVWAAFANPRLLERWFWPQGEGRIVEFDLRPGGRLVMAHAKEPWQATWEFTQVEPGKSIVLRDLWDDGSGHAATGTIELRPEAGGTRLQVRHGPFPETGPYRLEDAAGGFAVVADRLGELAEAEQPPGGFTIERTFHAPPQKVWAMWTTPEGIRRWWAPSMRAMGFEMDVLEMDVRLGGRYAFSMKSKEHDLVNGGTYFALEPHREIGMMWHFDIFLAPGERPYPVPIRVLLEPTAEGGTRMRFVQGPLATPGHTEGSRQGVEANLAQLAQAVDGPGAA